MPRFWINPNLDRARGELVALCDRCAAEEKTKQAVWYCQTCGELLEDVLPVRVLRRP